MSKLIDLVGEKFGRLTVIERDGNSCPVRFICLCDCGNRVSELSANLTRNRVLSCGCYRKENTTKIKTIHGKSREKIYGVWNSIRMRCINKNDLAYKDYGGRGIKVCEDWNEFQKFYDWSIANGYKEGLSIDRIDNNGNYCPENCRWTTQKIQNRNRRSNHFVEYNGKKFTIAELSELTGISRSTILWRINNNWDIDDCINKPAKKEITFNGKTMDISSWSKETGINATTLYKRLRAGWSIEKALTTPSIHKNNIKEK